MAEGDDRKTQLGVAIPPEPGANAEQGQAAQPAQPGSMVPVTQEPLPLSSEMAPPIAPQPGVAPPHQGVPFAIATEGRGAAYDPTQLATTTAELPKDPMEMETLSGRFIWISLWRAFRLQIHTNEVLAGERKTLEDDAQHIVDPEQQAFLAWRRSVLLLVAILFVPLTIVRLIEAFEGPPLPTFARMFVLFPAIAEGIFCAIAFDQLKNWTRWKQQRRILFIAWAIYMFAPFLVYLYPFRAVFDDSLSMARQAAEIGGVRFKINRETAHLAIGLAFGVKAQLILAPKIISLMPGLIRASIVSKLLFPGMTAPGWLMLLAAPLYALFAYIMVLLPYQITGQWYFVAGNAGLMTAQIFIGWSGRVLTVPLATEEAHQRIHRSWLAYILIMAVSACFMLYGLYDFILQLHLGIIRIISGVLAFMANVLLLTLVGTDLIVGGMAYFRKRAYPDPERERLLRASEEKLDRFST